MSSSFYLQAKKKGKKKAVSSFCGLIKMYKPVNDAEILVSLKSVGSLLLALLGRFDFGQVFSYEEE